MSRGRRVEQRKKTYMGDKAGRLEAGRRHIVKRLIRKYHKKSYVFECISTGDIQCNVYNIKKVMKTSFKYSPTQQQK